MLKRVAEDTPRPIRQIIPEVPQWLCDLIARLHAKDPAHRFQSAAEVAALLEQHLALLQGQSLIARPKSAKVPRRPKPRWVAVLAAVGYCARRLGRGDQPTPSGVLPDPFRSPRPRPDGPGNGGGQEKTPDAAPVAAPAAPHSAPGAHAHPSAPGAGRRERRADRLRRAGAILRSRGPGQRGAPR